MLMERTWFLAGWVWRDGRPELEVWSSEPVAPYSAGLNATLAEARELFHHIGFGLLARDAWRNETTGAHLKFVGADHPLSGFATKAWTIQ